MKANNLKLTLSIATVLFGITLASCGGSSSITDSNNNVNSSLQIEKTAVIPVLDGKATATGVYVRNQTNKEISGISYGVVNNGTPNLQISTTACHSIPANSSCLLPLTTPNVELGNEGSSLIVATYNGDQQSKQLVNYRYMNSKDYTGVNFSDTSQSLYGTNDYATSYVFVGNGQSQSNIGFNASNSSLAVVSGLTNGKVDIDSNQVIALELKSNQNVTSNLVTLTPYTVTTSKELAKALQLGLQNNSQLQVTITPTMQGNALMSNVPIMSQSESKPVITIMNNGNKAISSLGLTSGTADKVSVTTATTNPCTGSLAAGASCNYQLNLLESTANGSVQLTLGYNNGLTTTSATQTVYYQNDFGAPMVKLVANMSTFSEQVSTNANITFNVENIGGAALTNAVTAIKTTLAHTNLTVQNTTCGATLAAKATCAIQVNVAGSSLVDSGIIYLNMTGKSGATSYSFMSKPVSVSIIDTTDPTVTSTTPQDTQTSVAPSTAIVVNFSEAMTATTLNNTNIVLQKVSNSSAIPLTLQGVTNNNQTVTFNQTSGRLGDFTQYKIVINPSQIKDANGNEIGNQTESVIATFTTGDGTAPSISGFTPANGAINQSRTPSITIQFSESMDQATLTTANIMLHSGSESGALVNGYTTSYNTATNTVTISLGSALSDTTTYYLTVNQQNVKDLSGNALGTNVNYTVSSFTTGDFTAPTLSSTVPVNGATDVAVESAFSLTFSEAMDTTTLTTTNIKLQKASDNSDVALNAATYSNGNKTVTIKPTANLTGGESYNIVINQSGIKDVSGNTMGESTTQTVSNFSTIPLGDTIYFSTGQGLAYSNDILLSGNSTMYGVNGDVINYLGIDAALDYVYVLAGNYVYKYNASESEYVLIGNGILPGSPSKIVVNSSNKNVYALVYLNSKYYVYVSTAGTSNWTQIGGGQYPGSTSGTIYIGIDSGNGNVYINCGCGGDMYKSAGGTGNWTSIGKPSDGSYGFVVDSSTHNIYVSGSQVMKLAGGTGSWTSIGSPATVNISYSLALDASGNLYSSAYTNGLTYTAKYTTSWSTIGSTVSGDMMYPQGIAVNSTGVFVPIGNYNSGYNIYLSSNGTGAWTNLNYLSNSVISSPTSSNIYSINRNDLSISKYNGSTWQSLSINGAINTGQITSLFGDANNIYASTNNMGGYGVYKWNGSSWSAVASSVVPNGAGVNQAILHSDNCIYVGTGGTIANANYSGGGNLYKLCNGTWTTLGGGTLPDNSYSVENISINGNKIYAASDCSNCYDEETYDGLPSSVYMSNNGANWVVVGGSSVPNSMYYAVLVATDTSNNNVYTCVTSSTYCYVSASGTANWTALPSIPSSLSGSGVRNIMYVNSTNHYLYVGSSDGNVYVYNGTSWAIIGGSKPDGTAINAIKLMANGDVYAATALGNIYQSSSGTGNWVKNTYGKYGFPIYTIFAK